MFTITALITKHSNYRVARYDLNKRAWFVNKETTPNLNPGCVGLTNKKMNSLKSGHIHNTKKKKSV